MRRRRFLTHTDPVGERLHALAMSREVQIADAHAAAVRLLRLPPGEVGVLLMGRVSLLPRFVTGTAHGMPVSELLAIAQSFTLDTTPGEPGSLAVLVLDVGPLRGSMDGAVCWLLPVLASTARGLA